ncbi:MAG: hypothetical protein KA502_01425 [Candidatus Methanomethylophilaceae archaeon]|nr:hypothetical protein [Candidatus Methanomethylophilaceae archaeon]
MSDMIKSVGIGCAVALLGGIVAIACMAMTFELTGNAMAMISFYLLIAALFFASAGAYTKNSQWDTKVTLLIAFLNLAVIILAALYGSISTNIALVLGVFGLLMVIIPSFPSVKVWLDSKD